jgi:hypothetical protein
MVFRTTTPKPAYYRTSAIDSSTKAVNGLVKTVRINLYKMPESEANFTTGREDWGRNKVLPWQGLVIGHALGWERPWVSAAAEKNRKDYEKRQSS